jgi:hypothetical protein
MGIPNPVPQIDPLDTPFERWVSTSVGGYLSRLHHLINQVMQKNLYPCCIESYPNGMSVWVGRGMQSESLRVV